MRTKKKLGCLFTVLLIIILTLLFLDKFVIGIFHPLPYRSMAPFKGKVIDKGTKEPIAGAVVLAVYYKYGYSVAGEMGGIVDGQETLTDKDGKFKIPMKRRWFVADRGYTEGKLIIFKSGYGSLPRHQESEAVGENKGWPPARKFVLYRLPKLHTIDERKENANFMDTYDEIPYQSRKMYFEKLNKENIALGYPAIPVPNRDYDSEELAQTIRRAFQKTK